MKLRVAMPLVGFLVPSLVIGYGFVLPRAGFGGVNEMSIGYAATLIGATITYVIGVRAARRD
jgi:ABC-type Fe3+ transport system permease subunit